MAIIQACLPLRTSRSALACGFPSEAGLSENSAPLLETFWRYQGRWWEQETRSLQAHFQKIFPVGCPLSPMSAPRDT